MTDFLTTLSSPKEWPETWNELQMIDSLLRCSVCGEFFKNATLIPTCSHTYCSVCIRRYLCVVSKCPSCAVAVQESQLENNRIIDEIVSNFVRVRTRLLNVVIKDCSDGDKVQSKKPLKEAQKKDDGKSKYFSGKVTPTRSMKTSKKRSRKVSDSSSDGDTASSNEKWTPTNRKKLRRSSLGRNVVDTTTDSDEISIVEKPTPKKAEPSTSSASVAGTSNTMSKEESLVDCPVCGRKIPTAIINSHLDSCLTSTEKKEIPHSFPGKQSETSTSSKSNVGANSFIPQVEKRKPLNKLVYKLLSTTDLKKIMKGYGLSIKGDRKTLEKRHQEFTILYNSECSRPKPKSVTALVRLVEEGERNKSKRVESHDKLNFDRGQSQEEIDEIKDKYMSQNESEFTRLVNEVKNRRKKEKSSDSKSTKASSSKKGLSPLTSKQTPVRKPLPCAEDGNASDEEFEPDQKRFNATPRAQRSSRATEKRQTRLSAKKLEENVDDGHYGTTGDMANHEEPGEPMETSNALPDPPSPSLIDLENLLNSDSSESESMLRPTRGRGPSSGASVHEIPESDDSDHTHDGEIIF